MIRDEVSKINAQYKTSEVMSQLMDILVDKHWDSEVRRVVASTLHKIRFSDSNPLAMIDILNAINDVSDKRVRELILQGIGYKNDLNYEDEKIVKE